MTDKMKERILAKAKNMLIYRMLNLLQPYIDQILINQGKILEKLGKKASRFSHSLTKMG